ncbi:hypothetical protein F240042I4_09090 [Eisenbergiella tayi]
MTKIETYSKRKAEKLSRLIYKYPVHFILLLILSPTLRISYMVLSPGKKSNENKITADSSF